MFGSQAILIFTSFARVQPSALDRGWDVELGLLGGFASEILGGLEMFMPMPITGVVFQWRWGSFRNNDKYTTEKTIYRDP